MTEQELNERVKQNLNTETKKYSFKLTDIVEIIEAPYLTKHEEQIYLYKQIHNSKHLTPTATNISIVYFIINSNGEICGKIPITVNESPNHASMDYWLKPKFQGLGIGSVAIATTISHLFTTGELDNLEFNTHKGRMSTSIDEIQLDINTNNIPSRKVATKLGFVEDENDPTTFLLTKENYLNKKLNCESSGEKI